MWGPSIIVAQNKRNSNVFVFGVENRACSRRVIRVLATPYENTASFAAVDHPCILVRIPMLTTKSDNMKSLLFCAQNGDDSEVELNAKVEERAIIVTESSTRCGIGL